MSVHHGLEEVFMKIRNKKQTFVTEKKIGDACTTLYLK